MKRLTNKEFIKKAKEIHGDKYDYSKVEYANSQTKVCIICPEHGEFWMRPNDHLRGHGCPYCVGLKKLTTEEFIKKAKKVHGDKYDYSKVEYVNNKTNVCIICPEHGEFWIRPDNHLRGNKCPLCCDRLWVLNKDIFSERSNKIHNNKYDYSKVEYIDNSTKVCIICPKHGEFWQTPSMHMEGHGCPKCKAEQASFRNRYTTEQFINKARLVHGDKYDYSRINYINRNNLVEIICKKHGMFLQKPMNHLDGCGCPKCSSEILVNENKLYNLLSENLNLTIVRQKTFKWLKYKSQQYLDFYLPDINLGIEYQGEQHYKPISFFGGLEKYELNKDRDLNKKELCIEHGIDLIYFTFDKKYKQNAITNINELFHYIQTKITKVVEKKY